MSPFQLLSSRGQRWSALATVCVHVAVLAAWTVAGSGFRPPPRAPLVWLQLTEPVPPALTEPALKPPAEATPERAPEPQPTSPLPTPPSPPPTPARQEAPPPPTAEEWAFAAGYTQKNSKAYRHVWGQQVRSGMGAVEEGPEQGAVRFRLEIAPDGRLARLETLWTTSAVAEAKARQAIQNMPPSPPTPTGQTLVFERTIVFSPHAADNPPVYQYDCEPDPPTFRNPYAWDAKTPPTARPAFTQGPSLSEAEREDCLRQLPTESIDAAVARDRRVMERWGWSSGKAPGEK